MCGVEVIGGKEKGKIRGWGGYSVRWNERELSEINKGKGFGGKLEKGDKLNIIGNWKMKGKVELRGRWR